MNKSLPNNIEAEQSVLGAMFLSRHALQRAMEVLNKDLFYLEANSKIFETISNLAERGIPIDATTVTAELDKEKILSQVGGVEYITEVINIVPTAANVDEYIRIVEEKAILRNLIENATDIATIGYTSKDDITEILDNAEKKILNVVKSRKSEEFKSIKEVLTKTQLDLETLSKSKGEITGIATGFYDLDKVTSGLHENEFIIIAARPAMGKTAFLLNLVSNIAINSNKTVALFNLEMGAEQLAQRMLSSLGQIDGYKFRSGKFENEDWKKFQEAISKLEDTNIYIDDTPGITIAEIRAKCRRLASSEKGLDVVIIDYLQLISGSAKYSGNRQQEVSEISRSLKTLAMELNIPVIAAAQLSRTVEGREDKRPLLSDLRESGSIEQDADIVSFLYRDDYYTKEPSIDENTSKSEFIIAKHRSGPTTTIDLIFRRNTSTFVNMLKEV
ncbi:MAG: replicative DNA helicase [Clostridium sp.]|nr:replicative DNA helicase [Clostridium sp.]MCM1443745.1 replicative DNA helicase [Candidatus Amulumruptor caecigallinarius]